MENILLHYYRYSIHKHIPLLQLEEISIHNIWELRYILYGLYQKCLMFLKAGAIFMRGNDDMIFLCARWMTEVFL